MWVKSIIIVVLATHLTVSVKMKDLSKALYYFRLSTVGQDTGSTVKHYIDRGLEFGFTKEQIFYEIDSGGNDSRERYNNILQWVEDRKITTVYVPELTRFSRSVKGFEEVMETMSNAGAELKSLEGTEYKFDTPDAKLSMRIQISFAQKEREINRKRAVDGHKYLRKNAIPIRAIFPYKKENNKLIPNYDLYCNTNVSIWQIANEIIDRYIEVRMYRTVVREFMDKYGLIDTKHKNLKFPQEASGLRRWLKREELRGNLHYKTTNQIVYGTHTPLLEGERLKTLDKVLAISNQGNKPKRTPRNLWKGLMFCRECGSPMRIQSNTIYKYVLCSQANPKSIKELKRKKEDNLCSQVGAKGLTPDKLKQLTINELTKRAIEIANQVYEPPKVVIPEEVKKLQTEIEKLKELSKTVTNLESVIQEKQSKLNYLYETDDSKTELENSINREKLAQFGQHSDFWKQAEHEELTRIFHEFVTKIECEGGKCEFTFKV